MKTPWCGFVIRVFRVALFVVFSRGLAMGADLPRTLIAAWDFNDPVSFQASKGEGVLEILGGLVATNFLGAADDPGRPNGALSVRSFPAQGTLPRSAGLEFMAGVRGWRDLEVEFQIRASGTASRRIQMLLAVGEGEFQEAGTHTLLEDGVFENVRLGIPELNGFNEADTLRVRLVSDFDESGVYRGVKPKSDGGNSYSVAGTWRVDLLSLTGVRDETTPTTLGVQVSVNDDWVQLDWSGSGDPTFTVWKSNSASGPWERAVSGLAIAQHAEPLGIGACFFRVTSP